MTATHDPKKVAAALIDAYILLLRNPSITSPDAVQEPAGATPSLVSGCVDGNGKSQPDSGRRLAIRETPEKADVNPTSSVM